MSRAFTGDRSIKEGTAPMTPSDKAVELDIVADICMAVAELPDRTSPADWPEAMLVTAAELQKIVTDALSAAAPAMQEANEPREIAKNVMDSSGNYHVAMTPNPNYDASPKANAMPGREDGAVETPMSDHLARFWQILETEHVRILIDVRCDTSSVPYWDSSSFGDDVAKALVDQRATSVSREEPKHEMPEDLIREETFAECDGCGAVVPLDELSLFPELEGFVCREHARDTIVVAGTVGREGVATAIRPIVHAMDKRFGEKGEARVQQLTSAIISLLQSVPAPQPDMERASLLQDVATYLNTTHAGPKERELVCRILALPAQERTWQPPEGWKLVPVEPTEEMWQASRHALKNYIYGLTVEERKSIYSKKRKIYLVPENVKHRIRFQAMLSASPAPPVIAENRPKE